MDSHPHPAIIMRHGMFSLHDAFFFPAVASLGQSNLALQLCLFIGLSVHIRYK